MAKTRPEYVVLNTVIPPFTGEGRLIPEERSLVKNKLWFIGLLVIMTLMGCSHVPERGMTRAAYPGMDTSAAKDIDLSDSDSLKAILYAQYEEWKGTPHQIGGLSRDSIDCSGFVYLTFKSKLGIVLPRSTDSLIELGVHIDKDELRTGDLVFFKTGISLRHVGVYLERGRFMHASTKQGVSISNLNSAYWKSAYWKAKRLEM
ncbi:probable lipoprotein NlpC [Nitrosospira sp. Nsp18]|nr:probable lipoprotein NlpC [Nitrosospira sp. Nsp18]